MRILVALILVHGVVVRGPTRPVCQVGTPCSAPAVGVVLVFSRDGRVLARTTTGAGGRYTVRIAPGTYTVTATPRPMRIRPALVHVVHDARLDFFLDTGIR